MTVKRIGSLLLSALFLVSGVFATAQEPDVLIHKGEKKSLFTNPLEHFYETGKSKRPKFMIEPFTVSSGNWRGYVATWEIDNNKLYLREIKAWLCPGSTEESCKKVTIESVFPGKVRDGRISAEWFTGKLRIPDGKQLRYLHSGYGSIYERDILFDVWKGAVGPEQIIDNTQKPTPSEVDLMKEELAKLKAKAKSEQKTSRSLNMPSIDIIPGEGVFKFGIPRKELEKIVGQGEPGSTYDDVYFVEYPHYGVQASFDNKTHNVHVIFLYPGASDEVLRASVRTQKGIDWKSSEEDVLAAYGEPLKDFSDESKSWRRLEYPGIDFKFGGGGLDRIGILGPDGN